MSSVLQPPVLIAETHDVRPFARLLRGVGFRNSATISVSEAGLCVQVEEGRTMSAISYISAKLFDKYTFNPPRRPRPGSTQNQLSNNENVFLDGPEVRSSVPSNSRAREVPATHTSGFEDDEEDVVQDLLEFEVNLNNLLECLNIYGNAAPLADKNTGGSSVDDSRFGGRDKRKWAGEGNPDEEEYGGTMGSANGGKEVRNTGLLMSWQGEGYPLTLTLKDDVPRSPTTICKLDLLDPEEVLNEPFSEDYKIFHVIMKSTWLREAISDLDSSCSKVTIYAQPARDGREEGGRDRAKSNNPTEREKAGIFRLEATGNFGSTELDYPNDKDVMDSFVCVEPLKFSYSFHNFALADRAIQQSTKISLRIDDQGFCSLQLMMPPPVNNSLGNGNGNVNGKGQGERITGGDAGIVEFKFRALEDDVDDAESGINQGISRSMDDGVLP